MVLLSERAVREAQVELLDALGIVSEASGAASWAAARDPAASRGSCLVLVTGGNARPGEFQHVADQA
jgi:threonine dehydratase